MNQDCKYNDHLATGIIDGVEEVFTSDPHTYEECLNRFGGNLEYEGERVKSLLGEISIGILFEETL